MLTAWNFENAAKHLSKIRNEKGTIFYLRKRKLVLEKSAASRSSIKKKVPPVGALIKKSAASRSSYQKAQPVGALIVESERVRTTKISVRRECVLLKCGA